MKDENQPISRGTLNAAGTSFFSQHVLSLGLCKIVFQHQEYFEMSREEKHIGINVKNDDGWIPSSAPVSMSWYTGETKKIDYQAKPNLFQ